MKLLRPEPAPDEPSFIEATAWVGSRVTMYIGIGEFLLASAEYSGEEYKKSVGWFAIAAACGIIRSAERRARQAEE